MEGNASGSQMASQINQNQQTSAEETTFPKKAEKGKIKWPFVIIGILVVVAGIAAAYIIFARRSETSSTEPQTAEGNNSEMKEYTDPNGFSFSYPSSSEFTEAEQGVFVTGNSEVAFVIGQMEDESLLEVVNSISDNFGVDRVGDPETVTVNSRTGYKLTYEDAKYYYFPLVNDLYLEVVDETEGEGESEVVSSIKFTPPQASLN